ncbi:UDP-N-acetylmuramate dehydrogenase [Oceanospirillum multiglobuliferum]|uniref:UDP-N-acetylmuramate dehydrogenase n=1 Tax=Oceanospirillum multiglobuliferum TaxID=64969 RepID=UPI0009CBBB24|nr:UDP-N-acetylmuramate dehydrogenase [Oceanospirillum multiglobuliferum]SKA10485.1 UDP-N-acetylmuramate dehydrogenase [Oceanospirillum multiglobuliferum]
MIQLQHGLLIQQNVSLQDKNTFGFESVARYFCEPNSIEQCQEALAFARTHQLNLFPLGEGSNLILTADIDGLVLRMSNQTLTYQVEKDHIIAEVGAGVVWHELVMDTVRKGYYGLENLALIPGRVGAAPVQNIGAYGVELSDSLVSVQVLYVADGAVGSIAVEDCDFAYRDSVFKQQLKGQVVITGVTLKLHANAQGKLGYGDLATELQDLTPNAENIAHAVCAIRARKLPDPKLIGNAGSFFKNPIVSDSQAKLLKQQYPDMPIYPMSDQSCKLAAGWLIQQAGFKGYREGHVGVYEKQALVLVHFGAGQASDLLALAEQIQLKIFDLFNVQLEIEPSQVPLS